MPDVLDNRMFQIDNPPGTGQDFLRMDGSDIRFSIVCAVGIVSLWVAYGFFAFLGAAAVFCGLMYRTKDERVYYLIGASPYELYLKLKDGFIFKATPKNPVASGGSSIQGIGGIGLQYDEIGLGGKDTIYISAEGWDFSSLNEAEMYAKLLGLSTLSRRLAASEPQFRIGISPMFMRRPQSGLAIRENIAANNQPSIVDPGELLLNKSPELYTPTEKRRMGLRLLLQEKAELYSQRSLDVRMVLAISIRRRGLLLRATKTKSLGADQINRLPIINIADSAVEGLTRIGVDRPVVMGPTDLKTLRRASYDVVNIHKYYDWLSEQRTKLPPAPGETLPVAVAEPNVRDESQWRPQEYIQVFKDCLCIDGNWAAVIELRSLDPTTLPNYYAELDNIDRIKAPFFTRVMASETMKGGRQEKTTGLSSDLLDTVREARGVVKVKPRANARSEALQRKQELVFQSGFTQSCLLLFAVLAPSRDELEVAVDAVMKHAVYLHTNPNRITGRRRQWKAFLCATTGVMGML